MDRLGGAAGSGVDEQWIQNQLEQLRKLYEGPWCGERWTTADLGGGGSKKRKQRHELEGPEKQAVGGNDLFFQPSPRPFDYVENATLQSSTWILSAADNSAIETIGLDKSTLHRPVYNPLDTPCPLNLSRVGGDEVTFLIPPHCTFIFSDINHDTVLSFTKSACGFTPTRAASAGPGQFDFVLLDPPWPNRSVRRSRKYNTFKLNGVENPMAALKPLGPCFAPGGLVGCWITNSLAVRAAVLTAFEQWQVELVEEWMWLKVTSTGVPVTELGGLWRKPYESLFLGRKRANQVSGEELAGGRTNVENVSRRLLVAVPDMHSRKPCLKELIEPLMPDPKQYRALEMFARNLTAGWWAWGDECLKYNWEGYWTNDTIDTATES